MGVQYLRIYRKGRLIREIPLTKSTYTIGRHPANDIILEYRDISRWHGRIEQRQTGWIYIDLRSRNGSYLLQGDRRKRITKIALSSGMSLQLGKTVRVTLAPNRYSNYNIVDSNEERQAETQTRTVRYDDPMLVNFAGRPADIIEGLHYINKRVLDERVPLLIGRQKRLPISLSSPAVSRRHALLIPVRSNQWAIQDLRSTNGTFLNGFRILYPAPLQNGDVIQIGPYYLIFRQQQLPQLDIYQARQGFRLDGIKLSWHVGGRQILKSVSLSCYPQEFVALVGGSGAGKSTLMRILNGYQPPTEGEVLLSGYNLYESFDAYRRLIGYVPQDDILHMHLTVYQALKYSAKLRLSADLSDQEIERRIEQVLRQVELIDQKHQQIANLSGGQRKRASIAVELLADPPVLFLDEPTSGLDPGLERKMMYMLRELARSGKTIVLITHATTNLAICDQVAFLSQGQLVYYGPPDDAKQFFRVHDFVDIYDKISAPDPAEARHRAQLWAKRYRQSSWYQKFIKERLHSLKVFKRSVSNPLKQGHKISFIDRQAFWQFLYLARRNFSLIVKNKLSLMLLMLVMPAMAALINLIAKPNWLVGDSLHTIEEILSKKLANDAQSAIYSVAGNTQALLFMITLAVILFGLFPPAYELVQERHVYRRERMVFLQLLPYIGSKLAIFGFFAIVQLAIFIFIIQTKVSFPEEGVVFGAPFEVYISLLLVVFAAIAMGLFVSAVSNSNTMVVYIIIGILFYQIIFSGVIFKLPSFTQALSKATLSRWAIEALGITVNIEKLNQLSKTRFVPGEITEEVEFTVEKPDPDWEPVTVVMVEKSFPFCNQPIQYPEIHENELQMITETITETVTLSPDPITIDTPVEFTLNYQRSKQNLFIHWVVLVIITLFTLFATVLALKWRDRRD